MTAVQYAKKILGPWSQIVATGWHLMAITLVFNWTVQGKSFLRGQFCGMVGHGRDWWSNDRFFYFPGQEGEKQLEMILATSAAIGPFLFLRGPLDPKGVATVSATAMGSAAGCAKSNGTESLHLQDSEDESGECHFFFGESIMISQFIVI